VTEQQSQEEAHRVVWGNVQSLRAALHGLAEEETQSGDINGGQARLFIESKLAEIPQGASFEELWNNLEFLYRQVTAVALAAMRQGKRQAGLAFIGSAGMLLGLLKPELSEDERQDQLMASLDKRAQ
jgi:hypothetical protein